MEDATLTEPIARLREELDALDRAYSPGHHGLWSARRRAELFDAALAEMFDAADAPPGVGLAALGGYGRSQQLPRSDVDLLIVHDGRHADAVADLTQRLLYPLWDGGFEVGQAVRTPSECEQIAGERLDALTSMLDLRPIAGDPELATEAAERVLALAAADVAGFARALREDAAAQSRAVRRDRVPARARPEAGRRRAARPAGGAVGRERGRRRPRAHRRARGARRRRGVPDPSAQRPAVRDRQARRPAAARAAAADRAGDGLHRRAAPHRRGRLDARRVRARASRSLDHRERARSRRGGHLDADR